MKHRSSVSFFMMNLSLMLFLFLFQGCARLGDWAKEHFDQGEKRDNHTQKVRSYLRGVQVYDELDTVGLFDALWLNDEVRTAYADLYAAKAALSPEDKDDFLQDELDKNEKSISFYVVCFIHDYELGDRQGGWMIQLKVDDVIYQPILIEPAVLNAEYSMFLSKVMNARKKLYVVKFDAFDSDQPIIKDSTKDLELIFNTIDRSTSVVWDLHYVKFISGRCLPGQTGR
jgi:hypothetical protein